ncbi:Glycosyltransferase involved in cell wall bisynthesis [Desulfonatronum thiosulfatophilum]|uniref:Glycosyltransferase involved in cell wall bisynthesis n=1 Tax=Desulfonatronum thiosulfatophilum TaxID=617002 RepID=A0A1G6AU91_9BACT|nr:glycosyltransferase family 2 protein [Desulfonatronum thiosulfatophilum]SDB11793.1 Glycosyltransferase involved in cell wall bisynthesis [Desulfonatronum thiosulfatophilum]
MTKHLSPNISVTILTRDAERLLTECLQALSAFPDIVLLDNGSTDATLAIAAGFANARVFQEPFTGFGPLHNRAAELAVHDWILSIDSDEILTPELAAEIAAQPLDPSCVYSFPMENYFNGRRITCCGWHPDRHVRLFHRGRTRFTDAAVHEGVITTGLREIRLHHPVRHYSYACVADFLAKMQRYSDQFALQHAGRKSSSPTKAVLHGAFAFLKSYILKRGMFHGYEGLLISAYNAHTAFYKYLKLYEANQRRARRPDVP